MQLSGHRPFVVHDGLAAVEAAEHLRPDVVLLDVGLPKLSGIDACRRIRSHAWGKGMVIVALTGWGQESDRRNTKEAGFDAHLVKPVDYGRSASAPGCAASALVDRSFRITLLSALRPAHDTMISTSTTSARPRAAWISSRTTAWIIAAAFVVMAARLALFLNRYTVNIVYWDQWDFLNGLFDGADAWTLFRWQHGPQRQGIGNLILAVLYPATGWNGRADAAASAVALCLAGVAALWLVKRVCGSLRPWDGVVPLIFLTTTSAETYVVAPNIAHGPLSALLLTGYALALTISSHGARCVALVILNFLCVSTGFTWLLGLATPLLLLLLACGPHLTAREREDVRGEHRCQPGVVRVVPLRVRSSVRHETAFNFRTCGPGSTCRTQASSSLAHSVSMREKTPRGFCRARVRSSRWRGSSDMPRSG